MNAPSLLDSALKLSQAQRILLAEQLWESVARDRTGPPLTDAQAKELDRRLARLKRTGSRGSSWQDVKKRLKSRRA